MPNSLHYIWAAGHFILLTASLRYCIASFTLSHASNLWYTASYVGAIVSYAIVCHKSLGVPQPNIAWIRRALLEENVQYFLLAIFWLNSTPISMAMLPYTIFSLFHVLTFTRTNIMGRYLPGAPSATAGGPPQPHPLAKKLQQWVKANYDTAMRVVAYTEILIFFRVFFGLLAFQNSFLAPIVFAHFMRQRYFQSAFTREAVSKVAAYCNNFVHREGIPPVVVQVWDKGQMFMQRWVNGALTNNAPAAGAAPAAAGARR